ncbi:MAG: histidine phosphatase family protein [Cytophagales bacterium]|nr:histidine phosphatase family protein [Cytophagales bacterium]
MKTITFIRHGESTANAGGITMAHDIIPLSSQGERQAQALAPLLPTTTSKVLASSYQRAQQTAMPYCERIGATLELHPLLHEFSTIDPAMLAGMDGAQRKPFVEEYWRESSLTRRMGEHAETFEEFELRVAAFIPVMKTLPDKTVIFGHGMWTAMLIWQLMGFTCKDVLGMKAFRRFQIGLPMPNCAVYRLVGSEGDSWRAQVDEAIIRKIRDVNVN